MTYLSHYGSSSQPGTGEQKVPVTLDTTGKQQIQGWSPGDIQFRTKRPNPSHEVAAADNLKTNLARLGRIQGGPARVLKKETIEARLVHTSTAFYQSLMLPTIHPLC